MPVSTKDRIINASIDLISKNGYAETSIRDIAEYVGIKTSTIYYYFESKEAILNYILNWYMEIVGKSEYRNKWHEMKDAILTGNNSDISVKDIMNFMFFKSDEQHNVQHRKMVKIICSEAVRNNVVAGYLRDQGYDSIQYIKSVLDTLLEAGIISKCDTGKLAGVLYSITFAFMHLDSIHIQYISKDDEGTDMFSLLEYVLKLVLEEVHE